MEVAWKYLKRVLLCLVLIILLYFIVASCDFFEELSELCDEIDYGICIGLDNKTDHEMVAVVFPILTCSVGKLERGDVEQVVLSRKMPETVPDSIRRKDSQVVSLYLGENVDFQNLAVRVVVWKISDHLDFTDIQKDPYLIQTFRNPEFEIGPEKYPGAFAEVTIK